MSKNSARQTYEAYSEWYIWAKSKYPTLRKKKKSIPKPIWDIYEN